MSNTPKRPVQDPPSTTVSDRRKYTKPELVELGQVEQRRHDICPYIAISD